MDSNQPVVLFDGVERATKVRDGSLTLPDPGLTHASLLGSLRGDCGCTRRRRVVHLGGVRTRIDREDVPGAVPRSPPAHPLVRRRDRCLAVPSAPAPPSVDARSPGRSACAIGGSWHERGSHCPRHIRAAWHAVLPRGRANRLRRIGCCRPSIRAQSWRFDRQFHHRALVGGDHNHDRPVQRRIPHDSRGTRHCRRLDVLRGGLFGLLSANLAAFFVQAGNPTETVTLEEIMVELQDVKAQFVALQRKQFPDA